MSEVARAYVSLIPSFQGAQGQIAKELGGPAVQKASEQAGRTAGGKMSAGFKAATAGLLAGVSIAGIAQFTSGAVSKFSELEDSTAAAGVVFGKNMGQIVDQSKGASKELGLSQQQVISAANTFGTYGKAAGLTGKPLADFATQQTKLAADMASFKGTSPEQAIEAIGAALRGEMEPIRTYGVLLDDATLRNEALSMGLIKTTKDALTPQQKTLAAQSAILKQTTDAQGDFNRTSQSTANVQKTLAAESENLQAKLGQQLAPAFTAVRQVANTVMDKFSAGIDYIVPRVQELGSWIQKNRDWLSSLGVAVGVVVGAWGAYTLATKAWSVATAAATAIQRVFNAALRANPIGIIITAVSALVAGLVYFFTKTKTGQKIWKAFTTFLTTTITNVKNWIVEKLGQVVAFFKNLPGNLKAAFGKGFEFIKNVLATIIGSYDSASTSTVLGRVRLTVDFFKGLGGKLASAAGALWGWLTDKLKGAIGSYASGGGGIKGLLWSIVNFVKSTLPNKIKTAAANIWSGLIGNAMDVIGGVMKLVGKIPGVNGTLTLAAAGVSRSYKYAQGGVLPGYTPGRDVHHFTSPTGGNLHLSGGEAIMRPEFTRAVGGAAGVARLNAAARSGQAFADGGIWGMEKFKTPGGLPGPISWLVKNTLGRLTVPSLLNAIGEKVFNYLLGDRGDGAASGPGSWSGQGLGVARMTQIAQALVPGTQITSGFRPGAVAAVGLPSMHASGRAIDMVGPDMGAIFDAIKAAYPNSKEIIYSPKNGQQVYKGKPFFYPEPTRSMHFDHVHWGYKDGGVFGGAGLYDQGGWIPNGGMAVNLSGKPEAVLDPAESAALKAGLNRDVNVTFNTVRATPRQVVHAIRLSEANDYTLGG